MQTEAGWDIMKSRGDASMCSLPLLVGELNAHLASNKFLVGDAMTLADIAVAGSLAGRAGG
jgi:glutathione S-transferase